MALYQFRIAQNLDANGGHATQAVPTKKQPFQYDFLSEGCGFPKIPQFEDKLLEREYKKERLAAAFRIFGKKGFDEGVAGHITVRASGFHSLLS
jgi:hypothetical protein